MPQVVLAARTRRNAGKAAARKLRSQGQFPAVFYGPGSEPLLLSVDQRQFEGLLRHTYGENMIVELQVESEPARQAMLKELQVHPLRHTVLHADFYEISMDREITVDVPVHLVNTPIGVTNGGILETIRREITITCLPTKLVDAVEVDVSALDIGSALHISDLVLPEGIVSTEEGHLTVAVVSAPAAAPEEEAAEEEEALEEGAEAAAESTEGTADKTE